MQKILQMYAYSLTDHLVLFTGRPLVWWRAVFLVARVGLESVLWFVFVFVFPKFLFTQTSHSRKKQLHIEATSWFGLPVVPAGCEWNGPYLEQPGGAPVGLPKYEGGSASLSEIANCGPNPHPGWPVLQELDWPGKCSRARMHAHVHTRTRTHTHTHSLDKLGVNPILSLQA